MVNFAQIQIFCVVVETGGFMAAAEKLHRSQPAITSAIKKLESSLGFELFDRNHYRPVLTAKGESFYCRSQDLVVRFKQLELNVCNLRAGVEMRMGIDLDIAMPVATYTPLIQSTMAAYPQTCFSLSNGTFIKCIERLLRKECNISLAASHFRNPEIEYLPLTSIDMIPVASRDYFAQYEGQINNPFQNNPCMQIMIDGTQEALYQLNIEPLSSIMPQWLVSDMFTRKQLILSGMGIGRLPKHLIEAELKAGLVVRLNPQLYKSVTMPIYAMRLHTREQGVISNHFWQGLKDVFESKSDSLSQPI